MLALGLGKSMFVIQAHSVPSGRREENVILKYQADVLILGAIARLEYVMIRRNQILSRFVSSSQHKHYYAIQI
jgi:hypothetical protein